MSGSRVLVVGAGAIGLLSAYLLGRAGIPVSVLDAQGAGQEASWAGGGIVSPLYPWRYSQPVTALAHWSQDFYAHFTEELVPISGIDPEVYVTGLYWLDLDDADQALNWAAREGRVLLDVPIAEVEAAVPLGAGFSHALHMPGVANVRNPRLVRSLREALLRMPNVSLHEHVPVTDFIREGRQVVGVRSPSGDHYSERIVVAAGAWSGQLLAQLGLHLLVEPVKGQMILFKCAEGFLPSMVLARGRYAIPRRDGHILIGSTLEHVGFDKTPTEGALASLRASAEELLPALKEAEVVGHWAGLRPGSPEGIPFIGEVPGHQGLWLNCGHYRNGLVLAPASCQLLVDLMLGRKPIIDPAPYAPSGRLA
ncbi:glycine oxidase ThiO [Phytopseudomonas flavescens]|nr:glycine oxidase ThiO [Pseudomonas flavescens]